MYFQGPAHEVRHPLREAECALTPHLLAQLQLPAERQQVARKLEVHEPELPLGDLPLVRFTAAHIVLEERLFAFTSGDTE